MMACNNTPDDQKKSDNNNENKNAVPANSKIKNGIVLKQNGLKAGQAFLLFDDGIRVPDDNTVQVNQQV